MEEGQKIGSNPINREHDAVDLDDEYEKFKQEIQSAGTEAKDSKTKGDKPSEDTNLSDLANSRRDKALDMENDKYQQKKLSILERYKKLPGCGKAKSAYKAKTVD